MADCASVHRHSHDPSTCHQTSRSYHVNVAPYSGPAEVWDAFARQQSGFTAFHLYAWKQIVQELYGHKTLFLAATNGESLAGVLPLVWVRSRLFGRFLVSMPFVSYGGPLGSDAAIEALTTAAAALARSGGADLLELRSAQPLPVDLQVSHRKVTVVLPLAGGPEEVFGRFKAKLRSQVRRPQKEGVVVRFGRDLVSDFHSVFARHMRDLGTPAQPRAFFAEIAERLGDDVWFGCAYLNGVPIACGAGFRWGSEFEITWASSLREFSSVSANMGLYWGFIERAASEGLTRFNFGRCTPGSATHKFKLQWGAVEEPLWWYQASASGTTRTPSPDSTKFRLATRVWQRLPVPLATALGPHIVRYLP